MGFRFPKRIQLVPGLWINLSTGGPGGKGLTANIGKRGIRTTVSVPGNRPPPSRASSSLMPVEIRIVAELIRSLSRLDSQYLIAPGA